MARRQGRYWMLTIPKDDFNPRLPEGIVYIKGQQEIGEGGFEHWQIMCISEKKLSLRAIKSRFGNTAHCELSRSEAAEEYVWKEDTRVEGTQFEYGRKPVRRNSVKDWDGIWEAAKKGDLQAIPSDVRVQHYRTLRTIASDFSVPVGIERTVNVFYGRTGAGKSRKAWEEAGMDAYPKDPRTKFWDGYQGQVNVVIDEFRGGIDISHVLRWFDRYPVRVEIKGASTVLAARRIWITSNIAPEYWYPELDQETREALLRRLNVVFFE